MQGIPWSTSPVSRSQFRAARQRDYLSVERAKGIPIYAEEHALETSAPRDDHYYDFAYMTKIETSTVHHFQLRHLLWAPSGRAVYYASTCHIHTIICTAIIRHEPGALLESVEQRLPHCRQHVAVRLDVCPGKHHRCNRPLAGSWRLCRRPPHQAAWRDTARP